MRTTQSLAMWTDNVKELLPQAETMHQALLDFLLNGPAPNSAKRAEEAAEPTETSLTRPTWQQAPILSGLSVGLNVLICAVTIRLSSATGRTQYLSLT